MLLILLFFDFSLHWLYDLSLKTIDICAIACRNRQRVIPIIFGYFKSSFGRAAFSLITFIFEEENSFLTTAFSHLPFTLFWRRFNNLSSFIRSISFSVLRNDLSFHNTKKESNENYQCTVSSMRVFCLSNIKICVHVNKIKWMNEPATVAVSTAAVDLMSIVIFFLCFDNLIELVCFQIKHGQHMVRVFSFNFDTRC